MILLLDQVQAIMSQSSGHFSVRSSITIHYALYWGSKDKLHLKWYQWS